MSVEGGSGLGRELWEKLHAVGVAVRLADRFGLKVAGADAERYLNGQVTNDVRLATVERSIHACVTDAKGRLEGEVWIRRAADGAFLLDGPLDLRESLGVRLARYAIADDVSFEAVAAPAWHVMGGGRELGVLRFGLPGCDGEERPDGVDEVSADVAQDIRVAMGLPGWGRELLPGMLPPEAGIESLAISYDKGCYVGQEVISRVRRAGKVNKSLRYLVAVEVVGGLVADDLVAKGLLSADGGRVGSVTSAVFHPLLDRWVALAYVVSRSPAGEALRFSLEGGVAEGTLPLSFTDQPAPYKEEFPDA